MLECMERSKEGAYRLDDGVPVAGSHRKEKEINSYLNFFSRMYDLVYEYMDQAGVLEDLEDVWMNFYGERDRQFPRADHLVG
jgi:hypothetical protein